MREVLILGGYGNFGKRIARALVRHNVPIIIAGRNQNKAESLVKLIRADNPNAQIKSVVLDAERDLDTYLQKLKPVVVINTCGPFQNKDYAIAETCIWQKTHYIDLADGRTFVTGITRLRSFAYNILRFNQTTTIPQDRYALALGGFDALASLKLSNEN